MLTNNWCGGCVSSQHVSLPWTSHPLHGPHTLWCFLPHSALCCALCCPSCPPILPFSTQPSLPPPPPLPQPPLRPPPPQARPTVGGAQLVAQAVKGARGGGENSGWALLGLVGVWLGEGGVGGSGYRAGGWGGWGEGLGCTVLRVSF